MKTTIFVAILVTLALSGAVREQETLGPMVPEDLSARTTVGMEPGAQGADIPMPPADEGMNGTNGTHMGPMGPHMGPMGPEDMTVGLEAGAQGAEIPMPPADEGNGTHGHGHGNGTHGHGNGTHGHGNGTHGHGNGTHHGPHHHGPHHHEHHEHHDPAAEAKMRKLAEKCGPACAPLVDNLARDCTQECDGVMKGQEGPAWCRTDCLKCAKCWGMKFPEEGKKVKQLLLQGVDTTTAPNHPPTVDGESTAPMDTTMPPMGDDANMGPMDGGMTFEPFPCMDECMVCDEQACLADPENSCEPCDMKRCMKCVHATMPPMPPMNGTKGPMGGEMGPMDVEMGPLQH